MKDFLKTKSVYLIGLVLVVVVALIIIMVLRIGNAYKSGISQISNQPPPGEVTHNVRQTIRQITFRKSDDKGCTEVTADGIVRTFSTCGTDLSGANRMTDSSNILRLFKLAGEMDASPEATSAAALAACSGYIMTIKTDTDTKSVCINSSNSGGGTGRGGNGGGGSGSSGGGGITGGGPGDDIIGTIIKIIEDIPPTPTVATIQNTPTPIPGVTVTPEPTLPDEPDFLPTPTPTLILLKPFTCPYSIDSSGKKHPYDVSNIICSELPQPGK
jgi:hypothetical protein